VVQPAIPVSATAVQPAIPVSATAPTARDIDTAPLARPAVEPDAEREERAFNDVTPYAREGSLSWEPVEEHEAEIVSEPRAPEAERLRRVSARNLQFNDTVLEIPVADVARAYETAKESQNARDQKPLPLHEMKRSPEGVRREPVITPAFAAREPIAFGPPLDERAAYVPPMGPRTERKLAGAPAPFDAEEDTLVVLSPPMLWPNSRTIRRLLLAAIVCGVAYLGWIRMLDAL
jgi:hypothetical protein